MRRKLFDGSTTAPYSGDSGQSLHAAAHAARWTPCLRALDADTDLAKPEDIAAHLFPRIDDADSALSDVWSETSVLRAGGHRRIRLCTIKYTMIGVSGLLQRPHCDPLPASDGSHVPMEGGAVHAH